MIDWKEELYFAKYHLNVAKRMLAGFDEYGSKRFLVGVIRELAKCSGKLVRAFLIMDGTKGDLDVFVKKVGRKYLDLEKVDVLVRVLELERGQRRARAELLRKDEILFEMDGSWRVLKLDRLRYFINIIDDIARDFPTNIKR